MKRFLIVGVVLGLIQATPYCDYHPDLAETPLPKFSPIKMDKDHPTVRVMDMILAAANGNVASSDHTTCMKWKCTSKSGDCEYCLPSLFIAGVSKGGTSALFDKIATHPDVKGYWMKEVNIFNQRAKIMPQLNNLSTFETRLSSNSNINAHYLDASVASSTDLQSILMLKKYAPNAKIIFLVRDMRARFVSWLAMAAHISGATNIHQRSIELGTSIITRFQNNTKDLPPDWHFSSNFIREIIFGGPPLGYFLLGELLIPWVQAFGSNILILDHADLLAKPLSVLRSIEHFAGLREHTYTEDVLEEVVNMHGHWGWFDRNGNETDITPDATLRKAGMSFGVNRDAYLHDMLSRSACVMEKLIGWAPKYEY